MEILFKFFEISIGTIFINNFVLSRFLGLCPFIGVSKKLDSVIGMGLAVIFVMTLSSFVTWIIYYQVLTNKLLGDFNLEFLRIIVFILVIAALVQLIETILKKIMPPLYEALGIYLPLITTNCAVLGVAQINLDIGYNLFESILHGFMGGVSFLLAMFIMATIRERLELSDVPKPFRGIPIAFITAGLMAMAFFALDKNILNIFIIQK